MDERKLSISKLDYFNFTKEAYYKEFDRRTGLNGEIGMQLTAIIAISGVSILMYKELRPFLVDDDFQFKRTLVTLLTIDFACIVSGIFFVMNSYFLITNGGRAYDYLPIAEITEVFFNDNGDKSETLERLIATCSVLTESNRTTNNCKSKQLNRSSKLLTSSIVLTFFISTLYIYTMSSQDNNQPGAGQGNSGSGSSQSTPATKPANSPTPFNPQKIQERSENPQIDKKGR